MAEQTTLFADVPGRGASISDCKRYRYQLWRSWNGELPVTGVLFVMLNPSTADGHIDDPTVRKCIGFAQRWGHSSVHVVNLFAFRATDPRELVRRESLGDDIVGPENDYYIGELAHKADLIIVAWGNSLPRTRLARAVDVSNQLRRAQRNPKPIGCLGRTKDGHPRHPLMLAYETPIESWTGYLNG